MIGCRDVERALREPGFAAPTDAMRRHADGCARCAGALRAALLLRLGSDRPEDATTAPGFEARLRARIDREGAEAPSRAREAGASAGVTLAADWGAALAAVLRPALGAAAGLALVAAALFYQAASGVTSAQTADLSSILSSDPAFGLMLSDVGVLSEAGGQPAAGAAPPGDAASPAGTPR